MKKKKNRAGTLLFLIGMFSSTQISMVGKIGISELAMVVLAPFLFLKNIKAFKEDGMLHLLVLALLWLAGAVFSDLYNHSFWESALKGIAAPVVVFSSLVSLHLLLRKNIGNLRWFLLGVAVSSVVSIFVFQRGAAGNIADNAEAIDAVVGYKLFWVNQLKTWLYLPIEGWYMGCPGIYTYSAVLFMAAFSLLTGGRSAFLASFASLGLLFIAGKKAARMKAIKTYFPIMLLGGVLLGMSAKFVYTRMVTSGRLGEEEAKKYESQTVRSEGWFSMLMAGREPFFVGLTAALDRPFVGHGSHAIDYGGYRRRFLAKYGTEEGYRDAYKRESKRVFQIPAHSYVVCYWMWHGIFALLFWLYVFWLVFQTFFAWSHVVPQLFGFLALCLPDFLWNYFFSPFGGRVGVCAFFTVCVLIRKIGRERELGGMPDAGSGGFGG